MDPDQLASEKPADLELQLKFSKQDISGVFLYMNTIFIQICAHGEGL